jgi:hypothetical protein
MKGNEFIKRVRKIAKIKGIACVVDEARGKGSHIIPIPYQGPIFVGSSSAAQRTDMYASPPQSSPP